MSSDVVDLPERAKERLQLNVSRDVFTSDLSVNEFLLLEDSGFEPLGLVMGSSVYRVAIGSRNWSKNMELEKMTQAMYHARELAITRMEEEAKCLNADGVMALKLVIRRYGFGKGMLEFVAIGTAVKSVDKSVSYRRYNGAPFVCDLNGQDFWTLIKGGYRPLHLMMGACVYHIAHRSLGKTVSQMGENVELNDFTQALYSSRELAMERMQQEVREEKAEGIVGVRLEEASYGWGEHVIEFFATGTAIKSIDGRETKQTLTPELMLSLN